MIRLKSEQRYQDDPVFAAIVDTLYSMLSKSENSWTPTELREAAMLAALKYEYTHVRPMFVQQLDSLPSQEPFCMQCGVRHKFLGDALPVRKAIACLFASMCQVGCLDLCDAKVSSPFCYCSKPSKSL